MSGPAVLVGLGSHFFITVRRRQAREMAALERERAAARLAERRALASELHDIVAHQLSLISMYLTPTALGEDRIDGTIEQLSRTTLSAKDDLTTLLFSLQAGESGDPGTQTVRSTSSAVAETLREAGHPTEVLAPASLDVLDSTTQKTLSRIVRESATNAIRYAAEDSPVSISFAMTPASVSLRVTSQLAPVRQEDPDSTGSGLLGLRERVEFTHGTLSAGEVGDEWHVEVTLPTAALVTAS
ncbi:hypothetical protein G7085_08195 [Tessaracoccus sp. HDW20]|uniref:sensor histidine kinase n=1 Tax=Tessaracoccus coleopterorum TaxID=2714950 RepID=UPI0018D4033C|nr:histidine kinase [Tessaracoccus coleopterorum]NHB84600.1 hypothetical protein [Tessaracoccus coleopterorum]